MNEPFLRPIIYLIVLFLIPLIPAILIYRSLPSETIVSGPLQGFNLQLSGAFAGYFILVLLAILFLRSATPSSYQIWTVHGKAVFDNQEDSLRNLSISTQPPPIESLPNGEFTIRVLVEPDPNSGALTFPTLLVQRDGFITETISLAKKKSPFGDMFERKHDENSKEIEIKTPIRLKPKTALQPYDPAQAQKPKAPKPALVPSPPR